MAAAGRSRYSLGVLQVVWYKRDLRVVDHAPLVEAARAGPVLPLYVVEPELWRQPDHSGRQWAFTVECLESLRAELAALGQPLVVRVGEVVALLERLRARHGPFALWSHEETGSGWTYERDKAVKRWARERGVVWTERPQFGVIRALKQRDGWAARWERSMAPAPLGAPASLRPVAGVEPGPVPSARELGLEEDACPGRQRGGRQQALEDLYGFLERRGQRYHLQMSSPVSAYESCSRLSAHLALGTLSMREVVHATRARLEALQGLPPEQARGWRRALGAFQARLHWHCHFIQKLESEPRLEFENTHPAYNGLREGEFDRGRFEAWRRGETGLPFVDACMRALAATGWINFRMRAMLCAVSSYHLWLHWREPALHLARLFTDYEPGIHYPQMQMQSGVTGINTVRIYNPVKQGLDHDASGDFIRRWVPELAGLEGAEAHTPWRVEPGRLRAAGVVLGKTYPLPVVDHEAAARQARERVWSVRRGEAYREAAEAIQERHGSRKSGLQQTGQRPRRKRAKAAEAGQEQLALSLEAPPRRRRA